MKLFSGFYTFFVERLKLVVSPCWLAELPSMFFECQDRRDDVFHLVFTPLLCNY